jgi:periplasmic protein TonB
MFETCMVESAGQLKSHNRKWTTAGAFLIEGALLAAGVLAALVHTDALNTTPRIASVFIPISTPIVRTEHVPVTGGGGGGQAFVQPIQIPTGIHNDRTGTFVRPGNDPDPSLSANPGLGGPQGVLPALHVTPAAVEPPKRVRVSVMDPAKLLKKVVPTYPRIAGPLHLNTKVLLHAVIAKDGSVQNLEVVSGHPLFNQTALEAVRQWVYRPTYLGGEPVEVETTITVNFIAPQ